MIIYVYSKCSTCQKALKFLKEKNITVQIKEIASTPPSIEELERMLYFKNENIKKLFNTSGIMYREMQLKEKLETMPLKGAFILLAQNGMLIKRPFLLGQNIGLIGFSEKEWTHAIAMV